MEMQFTFKNNEEAHTFCTSIVQAMELLYDIPLAEGLAIMNECWLGQDHTAANPHGWLIFHETEAYWARCLGNPNPCAKGAEADRWKAREQEAERRIERFRANKIHKWLTHDA